MAQEHKNEFSLLADLEGSSDLSKLYDKPIETAAAGASTETNMAKDKKKKKPEKKQEEEVVNPETMKAKVLVLPDHVLKGQIVLRKGDGRIRYGGGSGAVASSSENKSSKKQKYNNGKELKKGNYQQGSDDDDEWTHLIKGPNGAKGYADMVTNLEEKDVKASSTEEEEMGKIDDKSNVNEGNLEEEEKVAIKRKSKRKKSKKKKGKQVKEGVCSLMKKIGGMAIYLGFMALALGLHFSTPKNSDWLSEFLYVV